MGFESHILFCKYKYFRKARIWDVGSELIWKMIIKVSNGPFQKNIIIHRIYIFFMLKTTCKVSKRIMGSDTYFRKFALPTYNWEKMNPTISVSLEPTYFSLNSIYSL